MIDTALIVDDSLTVRMDLKEAFEAAGIRAKVCTTVAEAREALSAGSFSVVVLDVILPDGDGLELLAAVRRNEATTATPIMLLSTEAEVADRIRGLKTGADEYVGKPYDRAYVVARAKELARKTSRQVQASRSLLVIDDSPTFREALRAGLIGAGYAVEVAGSGEEGLRLAADRVPAAILVDGVLPGIDGATVIRRVRLDATLRAVPCLLLTSTEGSDAELKALDAGADDFVRKGVDLDVILAKLSAALRRAGGAMLAEGTRSQLGPKKILAVDDSVTFLQALADDLRGAGYDVCLAHSGDEALELLAVESVDCILLDLLMPGMSGQDTCRRIKAAPRVRNVPLLILTAIEDAGAIVEGLSAGADDFVSKSSDFEVLRARVRAQIRRKQFEDENRSVREELLRKDIETRAAHEIASTRANLVEELERANKELEAFSYSVSHDLRAPLRSIDGFSQALLDEFAANLDDTGKDYLRRIRDATGRMGRLIDDLLGLSKVSRAEIRRTQVDLTAMARRIAGRLKATSPERAASVTIDEGLSATADEGLMSVVLENLIGNAWKFTSKLARAEIAVGRREHDGAFFVRDNGAGFDMAYASKLFGAFQRLHAVRDFEGTGIGLATVQRVVHRHEGRIWAEGKVNEGATFFFTVGAGRPS